MSCERGAPLLQVLHRGLPALLTPLAPGPENNGGGPLLTVCDPGPPHRALLSCESWSPPHSSRGIKPRTRVLHPPGGGGPGPGQSPVRKGPYHQRRPSPPAQRLPSPAPPGPCRLALPTRARRSGGPVYSLSACTQWEGGGDNPATRRCSPPRPRSAGGWPVGWRCCAPSVSSG